jgi:hypothetical protein
MRYSSRVTGTDHITSYETETCEAIKVLELVLVGAVIAVFELAAFRWGADSRHRTGGKQ